MKLDEKYSKILVPLDGSKLAEKVLPYARGMALKFSSSIVLLNVRLSAEDPYHPELITYLREVAGDLEHGLRDLIIKNNEQVEVIPITVGDENLIRRPAESIVEYASNNGVDLIVMASHGHSGIKHWALGSITDRVLHISDIPVLMVRAGETEYSGFDKILVPLDGSQLSERVFPQVTKITTGYDSSEVTLLNVIEPLSQSGSEDNDYSDEENKQTLQREKSYAEKYLKRVSSKIGIKHSIIRTETLIGDVAETIIDCSKSNNIDLIIMSTHGHSGMSKWTLGNTIEHIINHSDLPVLVVSKQSHKPD